MAVCQTCDQEMLDHVSCVEEPVEYPDGKRFPQIPYGQETRYDDLEDLKELIAENNKYPCHDCGTPPGSFHHPSCDSEECPRCHGQLISCGCLTDDEEIGEEDSLDRFIAAEALAALRRGSTFQLRRVLRLSPSACMEIALHLERGHYENHGAEVPAHVVEMMHDYSRHFVLAREEQERVVQIACEVLAPLDSVTAPQLCYLLGRGRDFPAQAVPALTGVLEAKGQEPAFTEVCAQAVYAVSRFVDEEPQWRPALAAIAAQGAGQAQEAAADFLDTNVEA